jgi:hypothetical protein
MATVRAALVRRRQNLCRRIHQAYQKRRFFGRDPRRRYVPYALPSPPSSPSSFPVPLTAAPGWSLGGQLSIDIARVLALSPRPKLRVVGILMLDTLFPYWGPPGTAHAQFPVDFVLKNCPAELKPHVLRCMQWSKEDSDAWAARNWKAEDGDSGGLEGIEAEVPPPAVLLHATKFVPVGRGQEGRVVMVDYKRGEMGGWGLFPHKFIAAVWEVPAHHFGLFDGDVVSLFGCFVFSHANDYRFS